MRLSNTPGFDPQGSASTQSARNQVLLVVGLVAAVGFLSIYATGGPAKVGIPAEEGSHGMHMNMHMSAASGSGNSAARPVTTVTPLSCEKLPNVPGKSITLARVDFPPNAYTPAHTHPGSVTAFVLKGTLRSQLEGHPVETYTVGQTWFEPPGTVHSFAENASTTEPASILATFIADDNCGPLTILK